MVTNLNIVTIHNLKKYFGEGASQVKALDGINLSIEKGKFTAVIGASGSGKTTLLNSIGGLYEPTEGEVIVDGINLADLSEEQLTVFRRRKVGFVFQDYNLVPELTIRENILFPLVLDDSKPDKVFFEEITRILGLDDKLDKLPYMLSGGGQQCTAIARALLTKPAILLADEPTGSFDAKTSQNVAGLLKMTAEAYHQTLVMITHNLELAQLADRVVRMQDGRIIE
jgi:putative ABC transport system ATP-binding protein